MLATKKSQMSWTIALLITICLFSFPAHAKYSGGTGEPNDPYQIDTAEDLMLLGESPEDYDKHFILVADIDLDPNLPGRKVFDKAVIASITVPALDSPFYGVFDGNGHTISNLTIIAGTENLGLFGWLASGSEVKDLGVVNVNITSSSQNTGGLAGYNCSRVTNSYSTGKITGSTWVGGLVGSNYGSITASSSTGTVSGTSWSVGGLVGQNYGSITASSSTGSVSGDGRGVGGLVGENSLGSITNCYATGSVTGSGDAGGLVGVNGGTITESYSLGSVSGRIHVGGLVGSNSGSITASSSIGTVSGTSWSVGGLVGNNNGNITTSYSTGTVTGDGMVGGLAGRNEGFVTQCYSSGRVSGESTLGGLVGSNYRGSVTSCYSTGTVTGGSHVGGLVGSNSQGSIATSYSTGTASGISYVGGLVGSGPPDTIQNSVWDIETSGLSSSAGGVGLTTAEMMDPYMLGLNGFAGHPNWVLDPRRDYPRLDWEGTPGQIIPEPRIDWLEGDGTAEDPYQIDTAEKLIFLRRASSLRDRYFILGADIDLDPNLPGRQVFSQAVIPNFTGVFDGRGHTISHLTITGSEYLGLFGKLSGQVRNLGVVDVNIVGSDDYVGGLVGRSGTITNCYSTGSVSGDRYVGGLVGLGGITNACYSAAIVTGGSSVGGLVGENRGTISNCYSTGNVSGGDRVGGLAGKTGVRPGDWQVAIPSTILNCYSTGFVSGNSDVGGLVGLYARGTTIGSFWDIQTSGLTISDGGTGLTTAEMHDIDTYLNAGWDCVDEILNGTCDHWQISPSDYPQLRYHTGDSPVMPQGLGTTQEPYLIRDARDLGTVWFKPLAHYRLETSVDLSGITWSMAVVPWFGGIFDGNGYVIRNLHIQGGGYLGLFGNLDSGAKISNLGLEAVDINGIGSYVGGLVGSNYGGSVARCYSTGTISGDRVVGGLVGRNLYGSIATSYSTGTVTGSVDVGGLLGDNAGDVTRCYSSGRVSGKSNLGGLAGKNKGVVNRCYSTGTISGSITNVGGLLGDNRGDVTICYSTGTVSGKNRVGGLVGYNWQGSITTSYSTGTARGETKVGGLVGSNYGSYAKITTSYSTGAVSGNEGVGGLVGRNIAEIAACYATGIVLGKSDVGGLVGSITLGGGRVGVICGNAKDCFWDIEATGRINMCGSGYADAPSCNDAHGKTTAEMQTESTFTDAGWDFVDESVNGTEDTWSICEGVDYPKLTWQFVIGDFDGDAKVGFADFAIFATHWLGTDSSLWCAGGGTDLTNDGKIRFDDLREFAENWLQPQPQEPPPPPGPLSPPVPPPSPCPPPPPTPTPGPPPKGRGCFLANTLVWVNGALVQISNVVSGQMVGEPHCDLATSCLEQIERIEEHEGAFECRDIVLESGNRISVVDAHCFMLDSGRWIAAQDLRSGLRLKTLSGTVGIKSVAKRAAPFVGKVYNLKIKGGDQYFVGKDRVTVRDY